MGLLPYGTFKMVKNLYYAWNYMSPFARTMYLFMLTEYIMIFILNIYWYRLVIEGVLI